MHSIDIENLSKTFRRFTAVNQVNLRIAQGECIALAGHNGAGKSTLIKMMLGIIQPSAGHIRINGKSPQDYALRRQIGYLPETVSLYPSLNAIETLNFFSKLKGLSKRDNMALLEQVGIADAAKRRVGTYSKGMRQRLALAQALLGNPQILFFDEPTTGLDPASRQQFYELLQELRGKGASILLSTHALSELIGQVDRIVIMKHGHKMADGNLYELREQAQLPTQLICYTEPNSRLPPQWQAISDSQWRRFVSQSEKTAVLAELFAALTPREIDILPPTLDDLYAAFLQRAPMSEAETAAQDTGASQ